ncbi:MAG TPA: arylamine N-acetyltransferase [Sphingomicrobium sp.]|nr:arylamine N-acetyltransferase [Sphingomicrobium sp.]
MSEKSQLFRFDREPRVLVIGQDAGTLEIVVDEVRRAGIDARGMTAAEADGALTGRFDLIAFGGGITHKQRQSLEKEAMFHNPDTGFVRVHAPYAASQIVAAARNEDIPSIDLGAYFDRIGYSGPAEPTLQVLRALHELHPAAIPFEAIDVLLGRGIDISPSVVDAKLIGRRRGGYCYEQNGLFARVLKAIGFEVESLASHVRWMSEPGTPLPPLTHRVLRVMIDGTPWLADVGFGSCVPSAPLRMDLADPQPTSHESFRLVRMGPQLLLQALVEDQWRPVYSISSEPWLDGQYEMANWYTATHPDSHFRHRLIVTRTTPETRHILADGRLTIRRPDGTAEKRYLNADEIMEALENIFLLPVEPDWRPIAERAAKAVEAEKLAEAA